MDGTRFDRLTRLFRDGMTRRMGLGVLLAAALGRVVPDDSTAAKKKPCKAPKKRCGDRCVLVKTDRLNCGGCNRACGSGQVCDDGVCRPGVSIRDFEFQPAALTVPVGSTVVWTNQGRALHTATADGNAPFDSRVLAPGERYRFTFTEARDYSYRCTVHPAMRATITVTP